VFLILTIIQFVVIARGGERVAEVGARFVLDAMPGKQMAIDAELRSGAIDGAEARRRRRALSRESQFYGSMDGAMKFVKGDVIASLVITVVNVLGGLAIGVLQRGLPASAALKRYALLTIGDGLVSQIPALVLSTAAGILVMAVAALSGVIGFADDAIKVHHRRSLGLNKRAKFGAQLVVAIGFAIAAEHWAGANTALSFTRYDSIGVNLGSILIAVLGAVIVLVVYHAVIGRA